MTGEFKTSSRVDLFSVSLAELALLLFFLLALIAVADSFNSAQKEKKLKLKEQKLKVELELRKAESANPEAIKQFLEQAREESPEFEKMFLQKTQKIDSLQNELKLREAESANPEEIKELVERAKEEGPEFVDLLRQAAENIAAKSDLQKKEKALAKEKQKFIDLQGENKELKKTLSGYGPQPCWPKRPGGKWEHLYKVTIFEGWVQVSKEWPAHQEDFVRSHDGFLEALSDSLSIQEFRERLRPQKLWSDKNECSFSVLIKDKTGESSKGAYKKAKEVINDNFYHKYEIK